MPFIFSTKLTLYKLQENFIFGVYEVVNFVDYEVLAASSFATEGIISGEDLLCKQNALWKPSSTCHGQTGAVTRRYVHDSIVPFLLACMRREQGGSVAAAAWHEILSMVPWYLHFGGGIDAC